MFQNLKITVTPVQGKDLIGHETRDMHGNVMRQVANLQDQIVRKQLIDAGWTPPGAVAAQAPEEETMTDRELLELAAKAAGIRIDKSETNGGGVGNDGFCVTGDAMLDWHNNIRWNPLTEDGDALRLAVKLDMQIWRNTGGTVFAMPPGDVIGFWTRLKDEVAPDPCAAYRRAIVRAAAEIGKAMP